MTRPISRQQAKHECKPAKPENTHPFYETWMEQNGYLKKHLDEACEKIAELTVENKKLKDTIALGLPIGRLNTIRDKPR